MTKHFHISIQDTRDWAAIPTSTTALPMPLSEAKEIATFYDAHLHIQTDAGEYLGSINSSGKVFWREGDDITVDWCIGVHGLLHASRLVN